MSLLVVSTSSFAQNSFQIKGKITSEAGNDAVSLASIQLKNDKINLTGIATEQGEYIFKSLAPGTYTLSISSINYRAKSFSFTLKADTVLSIKMAPLQRLLDEVFVTASVAKSSASTSIIDTKAMQLLQPSSFTDLLELLPGGRSIDPKLGQLNQIQLRVPSNYASSTGDNMASLGTAFYVDGALLNTSANMQTTAGFTTTDPNGSRTSVNKGMDMRSISTDQIERVEIVRGIPSAEYGDLTSGLVKIERKKGTTPYTARLKADGFSKLYAIGKGASILSQNLHLNANIDFLDSKSDPRDNYENYKRITGSLRTEKTWENNTRDLVWSAAFDYSTTVDNQRTDPDNSYQLTDKYTSTYNSYGFTNKFNFKFKKSLFTNLEVIGSINYQNDIIDLTKWIQASTATILVNSMEAGVHDAKYATPSYAAKLDVEGKPLSTFLKVNSGLETKTGMVDHQIRFGANWSFSKNYGSGQVYDLDFPPSTGITVRPRPFKDIPAMQSIAFYIEDGAKLNLGKHLFNIKAGIRGMTLVNLDPRYALAKKVNLDPRINLIWNLPERFINGSPFNISFGGGFGLQTKNPTLDMLYPAPNYKDVIQLNYFHNNPEFRRANALTTITDRVNYDLKAAVNKKWEINTDLNFAGNRLTITFFNEKLSNGFRSQSKFQQIAYKKYDNTSIDANAITEKPALSDFTYTATTEYHSYSIHENGAGSKKVGTEFQYTSPRFKNINTRFTLNGAWFNNTYYSSTSSYRTISENIITDGKVRQYLGKYLSDEGTNYQQFNTNLTIDSYLPKLGLMLSASFQGLWFVSRQRQFNSGTPISYFDNQGIEHPYTDADKSHPYLKELQENYTPITFRRTRTPLDLQVNVKASKEFKNNATIAMFVNRIVTYLPSYTSELGATVVRTGAAPYFGMELKFNL